MMRERLRSLSVVEKQVELRDKHTTFLMRIGPYRTVDDAIGGVVTTFVDISARRRSDDQRNVLLQDAEAKRAIDDARTSPPSLRYSSPRRPSSVRPQSISPPSK
jgi:hypothetical protein